MKKTVLIAYFVGYTVFFFLYSFVLWVLTLLKITPYGRFVAEFFKGRTPDEAKAHIEANRAAFDAMLPKATVFSNLVILPCTGIVLGFIVGVITGAGEKDGARKGLLWSAVAAIPIAGMLLYRSAQDPLRLYYALSLIALTAVGGVIGGRLIALFYGKEE